MLISVVLPAHNPDPVRFARVLAGLRAQTLPPERWEVVIVDSASSSPEPFRAAAADPTRPRIVREDTPGLTVARLRGFAETSGDLLVLVDDDNVLAPDYLEQAARLFAENAALGAAGGVSRPEFEAPPPAWVREFDSLLALRDLGGQALRADWRPAGPREYPAASPVGAGMVLRRSGVLIYCQELARDSRRRALDGSGAQLRSGGDNDLVMTVLETGAAVAYRPELILTHLIPSARLSRQYLGRLNRAISRSWVTVLALHGIRLWPSVARASVPLRCWRAWWRTRAWQDPAVWVRWQGRCGQFEGQADLKDLQSTSS